MNRPKLKLMALAGVAGVLVGLSNAANALQATTTFTASATVVSNCTIAATNLSFGNYDPLSASPNNATGSVTITCTKSAASTIGMDNGANFAVTRNMKSAALDLVFDRPAAQQHRRHRVYVPGRHRVDHVRCRIVHARSGAEQGCALLQCLRYHRPRHRRARLGGRRGVLRHRHRTGQFLSTQKI